MVPRAQHSRPAVTVMHPIVARDDVARFGLSENPTLQALEHGIGRTTAKKGGANVTARFGGEGFLSGYRHAILLLDGRAMIARIGQESIEFCGFPLGLRKGFLSPAYGDGGHGKE
jgi:hypothetical protein